MKTKLFLFLGFVLFCTGSIFSTNTPTHYLTRGKQALLLPVPRHTPSGELCAMDSVALHSSDPLSQWINSNSKPVIWAKGGSYVCKFRGVKTPWKNDTIIFSIRPKVEIFLTSTDTSVAYGNKIELSKMVAFSSYPVDWYDIFDNQLTHIICTDSATLIAYSEDTQCSTAQEEFLKIKIQKKEVVDDPIKVVQAIYIDDKGFWNFKILNIDHLDEITLDVFNAYGNLLYASNDYHNEYDMSPLAQGVYYYTISAKYKGQLVSKKSFVQLLKKS